jgi:hypothetical protein
MKQCPNCKRSYSDDSLVYCLEDGSLLATAYDPNATQVLPPPRATNPTPQMVATHNLPPAASRPGRKTWLILLLISIPLVFLVAAGGVMLWATLKDKTQSQDSVASETSTNQSARDTPSPDKGNDAKNSSNETSPSWKLVGTWRTNVTEVGVKEEITYTFNANGTSDVVFKDSKGRTSEDHGTWQYSDGVLFERFSNGVSGKGSIEWIDNDTMVITIIDNGVPAYSGLKRRYWRVG